VKDAVYRGMTYPPFFWFEWQYRLWSWLCCKRGWHLWDEVVSHSGDGPHNGAWHYLSCDACNLSLNIDSVDETYTKGPP